MAGKLKKVLFKRGMIWAERVIRTLPFYMQVGSRIVMFFIRAMDLTPHNSHFVFKWHIDMEGSASYNR